MQININYNFIKKIFFFYILSIVSFILCISVYAADNDPSIKVTQVNSQSSSDFAPNNPVASYGNGQQQIKIDFEVNNVSYSSADDIYKNLTMFDYVTGKSYSVTSVPMAGVKAQDVFTQSIKENIFDKIKFVGKGNIFFAAENSNNNALQAQSFNQKFICKCIDEIYLSSDDGKTWQHFNYPIVKGAINNRFIQLFVANSGNIYGLVRLNDGMAIVEKLAQNGKLLWQSQPIGENNYLYNALALSQNEKNVYVATNHGLIVALIDQRNIFFDASDKYKVFVKENNISENVNDVIVVHNSDVYLATDNGLVVSFDKGANFICANNFKTKIDRFIFAAKKFTLYLVCNKNVYTVPFRDDSKTVITGILTERDYGYKRGLLGQATQQFTSNKMLLLTNRFFTVNKFVSTLFFSAVEYGNHAYCFLYKDNNIDIKSNVFYVIWYPPITQKVTVRDPLLENTSSIIANTNSITIDPSIYLSTYGDNFNLLTGIDIDNLKTNNNLYMTVNSPKDAFGEKFDVKILQYKTDDDYLVNGYNILLPAAIAKAKDADDNSVPIYDGYGNFITVVLPTFGINKKI